MKKMLPLFLFCISFIAFAQDIKRENVNGKIIVEGNDIEGITIYNSSSETGTVSDKNGEFTLAVALNDLIEFRALEYQNFDVQINEAILASKNLDIFLIEVINKLDEVIITRKGLTGNINTDINKVKTFSPKLDVIYFGINNNALYEMGEEKSPVANAGNFTKNQTMVNGLNVVNIVDLLLIPLFRSEVKNKKAAGIPEVPVESIKYYLGSNFLIENFDIPEHRVEEFIRYVEDETFNFDLLNYGNEIEFLEILSVKSKVFLNTSIKKD